MPVTKLLSWLGLSTIVVVMVAALLLPPTEKKPETPAAAATSADRAALEALLGKLKRTWQPYDRTKLLKTAADSTDRFRAPLLEILQETHPLRLEAIQLAGELKVRDCHGPIADLAVEGPQNLRPSAILAAERLGPWSQAEVLEFLRANSPQVVCAALKLCAERTDRPLGDILLLLSHEDADVRQAAIQAIPGRLSAHELRDLMLVARSANNEQLLYVIHALGKTKRVEEVEGFLLQQLDSHQPVIRLAALDALTENGVGLYRPTVVWRFALNSDVDVTERAKAFVCLEKTTSFEAGLVRDALPNLHPYLIYFAARCLIRAGDKQGITALIDLLETSRDSFHMEKGKVDAVLYAARRLLTDLSKIPPQSDPSAWRQWSQKLGAFRPRPLGAAPLSLSTPR